MPRYMTLSNKPNSIAKNLGVYKGDAIDKDIPMLGDLDEINMNSLYLRLIFDEMVAFVNASHRQDINAMYDALTIVDALISPKVDSTEYQIKMQWLEANIAKAVIKDEAGVPIYYLPNLVVTIKKQLYVVFKIMLKLMDSQGMLTFIKQKAGFAMSKFRSA